MMTKTIMKVSPDKTLFGFDDVDPKVIALKQAILAGAAKKDDPALRNPSERL
jgi:hypothetical protein